MQVYKIFTGIGQGYGKQFKNSTAFKYASRAKLKSEKEVALQVIHGYNKDYSKVLEVLAYGSLISYQMKLWDKITQNDLRYKDLTIPSDASWATDSCRVGRLPGVRGGSQAAVRRHALSYLRRW